MDRLTNLLDSHLVFIFKLDCFLNCLACGFLSFDDLIISFDILVFWLMILMLLTILGILILLLKEKLLLLLLSENSCLLFLELSFVELHDIEGVGNIAQMILL